MTRNSTGRTTILPMHHTYMGPDMSENLTIADAEDINALHALALNLAGQAVATALECGQRLTEAKAKCKHGEWIPWL